MDAEKEEEESDGENQGGEMEGSQLLPDSPGGKDQAIEIPDEGKEGHQEDDEDGQKPEVEILFLQAFDVLESLCLRDFFIKILCKNIAFDEFF